jgi:hypothetical protein
MDSIVVGDIKTDDTSLWSRQRGLPRGHVGCGRLIRADGKRANQSLGEGIRVDQIEQVGTKSKGPVK